ncbi:DUF3099 domain-containing protein [Corynebacterium sp. AOP40-9SA-29]|uniref:DUF3099 domain-containing protein n=1 Tax=Corynebacterium sp. AOP40-9SA-29 TaxID=3457677 RepID=UPI0040339928
MSKHPSSRRRGDDVSVITDARRSPLDDWRHRRRLYAGLQLSRIPLLGAAVGAYGWLHSPVLAAVFAVISLPLPWVAVLLANEKSDDREKGEPKVYKPALVRQYRAAAAGPQLDGQAHEEIEGPPAPGYTVIDAEPEDTTDTVDKEPTEDHDR